MKKIRFDFYKFIAIFNLFLIPLLFSFFVVVINNYEKFNSIFKTSIIALLLIAIILFIVSFGTMVKQQRIFNKRRVFLKMEIMIIAIIYVCEIGTLLNFVYYNY